MNLTTTTTLLLNLDSPYELLPENVSLEYILYKNSVAANVVTTEYEPDQSSNKKDVNEICFTIKTRKTITLGESNGMMYRITTEPNQEEEEGKKQKHLPHDTRSRQLQHKKWDVNRSDILHLKKDHYTKAAFNYIEFKGTLDKKQSMQKYVIKLYLIIPNPGYWIPKYYFCFDEEVSSGANFSGSVEIINTTTTDINTHLFLINSSYKLTGYQDLEEDVISPQSQPILYSSKSKRISKESSMVQSYESNVDGASYSQSPGSSIKREYEGDTLSSSNSEDYVKLDLGMVNLEMQDKKTLTLFSNILGTSKVLHVMVASFWDPGTGQVHKDLTNKKVIEFLPDGDYNKISTKLMSQGRSSCNNFIKGIPVMLGSCQMKKNDVKKKIHFNMSEDEENNIKVYCFPMIQGNEGSEEGKEKMNDFDDAYVKQANESQIRTHWGSKIFIQNKSNYPKNIKLCIKSSIHDLPRMNVTVTTRSETEDYKMSGESILMKSDEKFVWIGDRIPPGSSVTVKIPFTAQEREEIKARLRKQKQINQ